MKNNKKIIIAVIVVLGFSLGSFFLLNDSVVASSLKLSDYPIEKGELVCNQILDGKRVIEENCRNKDNFDYSYSTTSRGTSMFPAIKPGYKLYYEFIDEDDIVMIGEVYAYKLNDTSHIVHRLIGMCDANTMIFKGDNEDSVEIIDRDLIERRLIGESWK